MQVACQPSVIVDVHSSRLNGSMINRETVDVNTRRSPTIRRRRLGVELRRHREAAGITIDVVAERLGCSSSKVSRIETGHTGAALRDVHDILDIYGVRETVREELVQIAREASKRGGGILFRRFSTGRMSGSRPLQDLFVRTSSRWYPACCRAKSMQLR
jgi:transcriptional regulator with XRE-family HTH domain